MYTFLEKRRFHLAIAAVFILGVGYLFFNTLNGNGEDRVVTIVDRGDVLQTVSVSGFVEAQNIANLSFPVTGIVATVNTKKGAHVEENDMLVTLSRSSAEANRKNAYADLLSAKARRQEIIAGPTSQARDISATQVAIASENLERTKREGAETLASARRTLLSADLTAVSVNEAEDAAAPTVSGSYICADEGEYTIDVYRSGTQSGYSYTVSGLENGTYKAFTDQPGEFGLCGLSLQFIATESYGHSSWTITVPNKKSDRYVANLNAYNTTKEQVENNNEAAAQALTLANQEENLANATPRPETLAQANAAVAAAEAKLAAAEAEVADRTIKAPFSGLITELDILPGETVSTEPVVTILADDAFDMTIRIPEIDVTKVALGQSASVVFDARSDQELMAAIDFISPVATEIDGVAYFEATLVFDEAPTWLRSGLNADVDIIVAKETDAVRLPKRYLRNEDDRDFVLVPSTEDTKTIETDVTVRFSGNDGYVVIEGLDEGTEVIAP